MNHLNNSFVNAKMYSLPHKCSILFRMTAIKSDICTLSDLKHAPCLKKKKKHYTYSLFLQIIFFLSLHLADSSISCTKFLFDTSFLYCIWSLNLTRSSQHKEEMAIVLIIICSVISYITIVQLQTPGRTKLICRGSPFICILLKEPVGT